MNRTLALTGLNPSAPYVLGAVDSAIWTGSPSSSGYRGFWVPDRREVEVEAPRREPSFHEFASEWFDGVRRELKPNTVAAYVYEITHHLLPFFANHRLSEITVPEVDRYRHFKVRERNVLRAARASGARQPSGVRCPTRRSTRRSRGSARSSMWRSSTDTSTATRQRVAGGG